MKFVSDWVQRWFRVWLGEQTPSHYITVLVGNYGISNTMVLEIPLFTTKTAIWTKNNLVYWHIYVSLGPDELIPYFQILDDCHNTEGRFKSIFFFNENICGPLLLTWFNFNPSMDK